MPQPGGVCVICDASLEHRRANAFTCSAACRRERDRILAILKREPGVKYRSLRARVLAAQKRAQPGQAGVLRLDILPSRGQPTAARDRR